MHNLWLFAMQLLSVFAFCLLGLLSSACYRLPDVNAMGQFEGIESSLDEGRTVSLFISHGLGGFSPKDPETLLAALHSDLGFVEVEEPTTRQIMGEIACRSYGSLEKRVYYRYCDNLTLYCYILDWRKATWDEKDMLRRSIKRYDIDSTEVCFIRQMRDKLFDDNLTDALMILGSYGNQVRFPFEQSFRWIYADTKCIPNHSIYIITHSFGGQLVLDSLAAMHASGNTVSEEARNYIIDHTRAFYMCANMAPFIYLHRMQPLAKNFPFHACSASGEPSPEREDDVHDAPELQQEPPEFDWVNTPLGDFVLKKRETDPCFKIIGFSDPNDLFSFYTRGALPGDAGPLPLPSDMMLNVWVRNAAYTILGAFVNPGDAHQRYLHNPYVLWMIFYGLDRPVLPPCNASDYQNAVLPKPTHVRLDAVSDNFFPEDNRADLTAEASPPIKPLRALGGELNNNLRQ